MWSSLYSQVDSGRYTDSSPNPYPLYKLQIQGLYHEATYYSNLSFRFMPINYLNPHQTHADTTGDHPKLLLLSWTVPVTLFGTSDHPKFWANGRINSIRSGRILAAPTRLLHEHTNINTSVKCILCMAWWSMETGHTSVECHLCMAKWSMSWSMECRVSLDYNYSK